MPSSNAQDALHSQAEFDLIESVLKRIKEHLESERHRVNEEIRNYPSPIPACDAQFNYLLEEQARIAQEFDRLKELAREDLPRKTRLEGIVEFITSMNCINDELEQEIRSLMLSVKEAGLS